MKYFTKGMWKGAQRVGPEADENGQQWQQAFDAYRHNLENLRARIGEETYTFFADVDVHDAELLDVRIMDGSRPAPLGEPNRPWQSLKQYPVQVVVSLLDAQDEHVWQLVYTSTRKVQVDFPSDEPLSNQGVGGFDDLGYHEIIDVGDGFLRHELLFSSGAVLLFEFKDVAITSTLARAPRS